MHRVYNLILIAKQNKLFNIQYSAYVFKCELEEYLEKKCCKKNNKSIIWVENHLGTSQEQREYFKVKNKTVGTLITLPTVGKDLLMTDGLLLQIL